MKQNDEKQQLITSEYFVSHVIHLFFNYLNHLSVIGLMLYWTQVQYR